MVVRIVLNILINRDPNAFFTRGGEYILQYLKKGEGIHISEYNSLFSTIPIPKIEKEFLSDKNFSEMRLAGWNPCLLERVNQLPENFPFSDLLLKEFSEFENTSLNQLIQEKKAYIVNYEILQLQKDGNQPNGKKFANAPIALFLLTEDRKNLKPVAIQCGQDPKTNPIFTPKDDTWAWNIAKLIVNAADGNHHELVTHLGMTHLVLEPIILATHRQISERHPIYQLLCPHFIGTVYINYLAKEKLIAPGGGVDYLLSATIESNVAVTLESISRKGFNDSFFPAFFDKRGTRDEANLPDYPYRDDGILLWDALQTWTLNYLKIYYSSSKEMENDSELQLWIQELTSPLGGNINNFGDSGNGKIQSLEYLSQALTYIIFTASVAHSAVNFPQKDLMMYTPGVPLGVYHSSPEKGKQYTEADWMKMLPPLDMAALQLNLGYTLGGVYFTKLGDYHNIKDPRVKKFKEHLNSNLIEIENTIKTRNKNGRVFYNSMLPSKITASINI